ncbi:hypothetical protein B4134_1360 [Bacillus safensis]|nr:hypothetical protein B4107_1185 [Bacillus safensis]KIL23117.1 hypothetical protein B4134_1360 [Bacillus safensis]
MYHDLIYVFILMKYYTGLEREKAMKSPFFIEYSFNSAPSVI